MATSCAQDAVIPDAGIPDLGFADVGFPQEDEHIDQWHPTMLNQVGPATLEPVEQITCRSSQRMSVDQIRRSVPHIMGGAIWDIGIPATLEINVLDIIGVTLGEADYITVNSDNRQPSPLFMKFMDNMATKVCINAYLSDSVITDQEQRVLYRYADPAENLRFLRLKFHGIWVPPNSNQGIEDLLQLYTDLGDNDPFINSVADRELFKWFGVCVAMLSSPEFFSY
jgi:hypothetical protein